MVNKTSCYKARKVLIYHFEVPFLQKAWTTLSVGMSFAKATTAHLDCEGVSHGPSNDFIFHLLKCSKVQVYFCPAIVRGKKGMLKQQKLHVCSTDEQRRFQQAHKCLRWCDTGWEEKRRLKKGKPILNRSDSKSKFGTDREILRTGTFFPHQFHQTKPYVYSHQ